MNKQLLPVVRERMRGGSIQDCVGWQTKNGSGLDCFYYVYLLPPCSSLRSLPSILDRNRNGCEILEVVCRKKKGRRHLVVCMSKNRKGVLLAWQAEKSIKLSNGKRLMREALKLIKVLRECRLKLDVGLKQLLQIDEKGIISLINIRGSGKMLKRAKRYLQDEQIFHLKYFCSFIKDNIKEKDDILKLDSLLDILSKKRNVSIEKIENLLNNILIETQDYIFNGWLNPDEEKMMVEITDRNDRSVRRYKIEGIVDVSGGSMMVSQLFGVLEQKCGEDVRVESTGRVYYWDGSRYKWLFFMMEIEEQKFHNEGIPRCPFDEDFYWKKGSCKKYKYPEYNYQQITTDQKQLTYPNNCIVRVESIGQVPSYPHITSTNSGNGALVHCNLVLTCAHNLYFFLHKFGQRVEARQVWIETRGRKYKVKDFRFPDQFKQQRNGNDGRKYDYALLLLEQNIKVKNSLYLNLIYDIQEKVQTQLFKVEQNCKENHKMKRVNSQQENIITHYFKTDRGDSGSSLLIRPPETGKNYFVIGIHYGKVYHSSGVLENKAVKITKNIIDNLVEYEQNMTSSPFSIIKMISWEEPKKMRRRITTLSKRKKNYSPSLKIVRLKNAKRERQLRKKAQIFLNFRSQLKKQSTDIEAKQKYFDLSSSFFSFCNHTSTPFQAKIKCLLNRLVNTDKKYQNAQEYIQILKMIRDIEEESEQAILDLDSLIFGLRFNQLDPLFFCFISQQLLSSSQTFQGLFQIVGLQPKQMMSQQKAFQIRLQEMNQQFEVFSKNEILEEFPCLTKRITSQIPTIETEKIEIQVVFPNKKKRDDAFWSFLNFQEPYYYMNPNLRRKQRHILVIEYYKRPSLLTIEQCLSKNYFELEEWVGIFLNIASFAQHLHNSYSSLSFPFERCLLINSKSKPPQPRFFYFQSLQMFKFQTNKLENQQISQLYDFDPRQERIENREDAFPLDIYMLGRGFAKIFEKLCKTRVIFPPVLFKFGDLYMDMTKCREKRISIQGVIHHLRCLLEIVRKEHGQKTIQNYDLSGILKDENY